MSYYKTFKADGDFGAMYAAERWLKEHGFSVGSTCRGYPRGIMFGEWDIAKWRNLDSKDVAALHGVMRGDRTGSFRGADVTIELSERDAPPDAVDAFRAESLRCEGEHT